MSPDVHHEVAVVGGGPAGLSAALILARCCRSVVLFDRGTPRSRASHALYGFVSRDGIDPRRFLAAARNELKNYPNVTFLDKEVAGGQRMANGRFQIRAKDETCFVVRKVLLATGVEDELPPLPDVERYFGVSVFPCPYCDGYELRNKPVAVYGQGKRAFEMARALTAWTQDLLICTSGGETLAPTDRAALERKGLRIEDMPIVSLEGEEGKLRALRFADGRAIERTALFFDTACHPQSELARKLGCDFGADGSIRCGEYEASSVPGVYVAGNILKDVQLSIVAAGEGARAAFGINRALTREDFEA